MRAENPATRGNPDSGGGRSLMETVKNASSRNCHPYPHQGFQVQAQVLVLHPHCCYDSHDSGQSHGNPTPQRMVGKAQGDRRQYDWQRTRGKAIAP